MRLTTRQRLKELINSRLKEAPAEDMARAQSCLPEDLPAGQGMGDVIRQIEQAFYVELLRKPDAEFEGSVEQRLKFICHSLRESKKFGRYAFAVTIYPDFLIACDPGEYGYYDECSHTYWQVPYTIDDANTAVTFGEGAQVDISYVFAPHTGSSNDGGGDYDPLMMASVTKSDSGKKFTRAAYLIGEATVPSTWKVRVEEAPGEVTSAQLGRAHAALTKVSRGKKVDIPEDQKKTALKKLKRLYAEHDTPWPEGQTASDEDPEWVLQGLDPPGGPDELTQRHSARLLLQSEDTETGIMKVSGVATVANVLNAMGQVYPLEVWQDNLPRLQRMVEEGRLVGEAQHPSPGEQSLDRTCMKYTSVWMQENQVLFEAEILPTDVGKNLQTLIRNGVTVDISSRGRGKSKYQTWEGLPNVEVIQRGFRCDALDSVLAGASPGATITDWSIQSAGGNPEEEMPELSEILTTLGTQIGAMNASQSAMTEKIEALIQSKTEKVETPPAPKVEETVVQTALAAAPVVDPNADYVRSAIQKMEQHAVNNALKDLWTQKSKEWGSQWANVLQKQVEAIAPKNLDEFATAVERATELVTLAMGDAPKFPSQGFQVQADVGKRGPQTPNETIEALLDGVEDEMPVQGMDLFYTPGSDGKPMVPGYLQTKKRQLRKLMLNIANLQSDGWNGPAALQGLTMRLQGYNNDVVNQAWLDQVCADGCTAVGAGGAPAGAIFIFPIVRNVFPRLIATEVAAVQPMDKPDGKIFYLTTERLDSGSYVDAAGNTVTGRMPINRSDSWSDSYANDPGECSVAQKIQLRLAAKTVTAETKKLFACWSMEVVQDLQAYHGLDAGLELTKGIAMEIALEWNEVVLKEMLAGATAGNVNYGTVAPSGYTQKEWDEYISRYVDAASNLIFKKRHGDMTHIIAGPDAALKLAASFRVAVDARSGPEPGQYAGLSITPWMGGSVPNTRLFKTSFWAGINTNKILVIRRGPEWSDTPYVWAPYVDYVTPKLVLPDTFQNQQGMMSRAAHKVVVGDAMSTVTIQAGVTGTAL